MAAHAKAIYDWACPGRDEKVRQEDLVNAFLEALQDDDQCRALEYPHVPDTIEEAALQAAHYQEAARRPTTYIDDGYGYECINGVSHNEPTDHHHETSGNHVDMANLWEHMIQQIAEEVSSRTEAKAKTSLTPEGQPPAVSTDQPTGAGEKKVTLTLEELQKLLHSTAPRGNPGANSSGHTSNWSTGAQSQNAHSGHQVGIMKCDFCGKMGHTESQCWKKSKNRGPRCRDKSQIDCYICGAFRHCWYKCAKCKAGGGQGALQALLGNRSNIPAMVVKELFAGWSQTGDGNGNDRDHNDRTHTTSQSGVVAQGMSGESQAK